MNEAACLTLLGELVKRTMMKRTCLILTLAGILFAAGEPATFTGVITDTLCGRSHAMMKAASDEACVKLCAKGSGEYALFDGKNVLKLSDQKLPAKFAAQRVKVTGTYDAKANRIKVISIEAAGGGESK
jgi:hypothetical protein